MNTHNKKYDVFIILDNPDIFKKIINSIKDLINNITFDFQEDGIHIQSLDKNHIAFIDLFINTKFFDKYYINKNRNCDEIFSNHLIP